MGRMFTTAAFLEKYVFPGCLSKTIKELDLDLHSPNPTNKQRIQRMRFALNMVRELTTVRMNEMIDRQHRFYQMHLKDLSELTDFDMTRFEISLMCIGLGIGEVCKKCFGIFPSQFSHSDICNVFNEPLMSNNFTVSKIGQKVKCKFCLQESGINRGV